MWMCVCVNARVFVWCPLNTYQALCNNFVHFRACNWHWVTYCSKEKKINAIFPIKCQLKFFLFPCCQNILLIELCLKSILSLHICLSVKWLEIESLNVDSEKRKNHKARRNRSAVAVCVSLSVCGWIHICLKF